MPDIKKEANVDAVKQLAAFKQSKLSSINDAISQQKSRAAILLSSIKAKRAELLEAEEQKRLQEEAALQAKKAEATKASKQKEEVKAPAAAEEVKEAAEDAAAEAFFHRPVHDERFGPGFLLRHGGQDRQHQCAGGVQGV